VRWPNVPIVCNPDPYLQLSSRGHRFLTPGIQFRTIDDLNCECKNYMWPEMSRYGLSKLAVVLWAKKLQRQFDAEGVPITAISIHPGEVYTGKSAASANLRYSRHLLRGCPDTGSAVVPATHLSFRCCAVSIRCRRERCLHELVRSCWKEGKGRARELSRRIP
jgi:hypothetical protein